MICLVFGIKAKKLQRNTKGEKTLFDAMICKELTKLKKKNYENES